MVLHTAGVSKAILANLPAAQREQYLAEATFTKYTDTTITDRAAFEQRLATVRSDGWAYDDGEYDSISNCIAAPVWDHAGNVAGGISITTLKPRVDLKELHELLPVLLATTTAVSEELGWRAPAPDAAG